MVELYPEYMWRSYPKEEGKQGVPAVMAERFSDMSTKVWLRFTSIVAWRKVLLCSWTYKYVPINEGKKVWLCPVHPIVGFELMSVQSGE